MIPHARLLFLCTLALAPLASAKVIGTNIPSAPLTAERIATAPVASQAAWKAYFERSNQLKLADQASLKAEVKGLGITAPLPAPKGHNAGLPLKNPSDWYASAEGLRVADCIVSFQIPSGGWGKNLDMVKAPRKTGQHYATDNKTQFPTTNDFDAQPLDDWSYVGTFDNDATITQLRFLAATVTAVGSDKAGKYREAFLRGMNYVLAAQYPNGGYPQVYPLMGGYHDSITMNDGAMIAIIELLQDVADGVDSFAWVPAPLRAQAREAEAKGVSCLLACQIRDHGKLTVWCQQHDLLTLAPASARNYEMPSECAGESAEITLFFMRFSKPTPEMVAAVHASVAWFEKTALHDVSFKSQDGVRTLVPTPGSQPIWARYYEIGTLRPLFGERDKSIHDDVNDISPERRNGYSWYGTYGNLVLDHYRKWKKQH